MLGPLREDTKSMLQHQGLWPGLKGFTSIASGKLGVGFVFF